MERERESVSTAQGVGYGGFFPMPHAPPTDSRSTRHTRALAHVHLPTHPPTHARSAHQHCAYLYTALRPWCACACTKCNATQRSSCVAQACSVYWMDAVLLRIVKYFFFSLFLICSVFVTLAACCAVLCCAGGRHDDDPEPGVETQEHRQGQQIPRRACAGEFSLRNRGPLAVPYLAGGDWLCSVV